MNESIRLTDPREMMAVMNGDIEGDVYADGEVYAQAHDLSRWRNEQPIATLEAGNVAT